MAVGYQDFKKIGSVSREMEIVIKNKIKIPHYVDYAEFLFSVHNFTSHNLKIVEIRLKEIKKEQYDEVQLPREGQVSENYELSLDLRNTLDTSFDLLEHVNAQFDLKPEEAEAFRLNIYCDDGYIYHGKLLLLVRVWSTSSLWVCHGMWRMLRCRD